MWSRPLLGSPRLTPRYGRPDKFIVGDTVLAGEVFNSGPRFAHLPRLHALQPPFDQGEIVYQLGFFGERVQPCRLTGSTTLWQAIREGYAGMAP